VTGLAVYQGRLYASGDFANGGGSPGPSLAFWDGASWTGTAVALSGPNPVIGLATGDLGSGPRLIAMGFPTIFDDSIALWDGATWTHVPDGPAGWVGTATVFNSGNGPELYVSGGFAFQTASGLASYVARWNGSVWHDVDGGLGGIVMSYLARQEAAGPALYFAGGIASTAPGTIGLARWTGAHWSSIGGGITGGSGGALAEFDDGSGPGLYVGGNFNRIGNSPIDNLARWDGQAWSPVGAPTDRSISALAVFDDGDGPALYAAGVFNAVGSLTAHHIARWRNGAWTALDSGLDGNVNQLVVFDPDGAGPARASLIAAGSFANAGGQPAAHIAAWTACPCYANCDRSTTPPVLNIGDFVCFQMQFAAGDPAANCDRSTTPPLLTVSDFVCFQSRFAAGCGN
jgi:hypothetical protein